MWTQEYVWALHQVLTHYPSVNPKHDWSYTKHFHSPYSSTMVLHQVLTLTLL